MDSTMDQNLVNSQVKLAFLPRDSEHECEQNITDNQERNTQILQEGLIVVQSAIEKDKHSQRNYDELSAQIVRQRCMLKEQLKFNQQRQRNIMNTLREIQNHQLLTQKFGTFLDQGNQPLVTIITNQLQANNGSERELSLENKIELGSASSFVSQLSDIVILVTETHLSRLEEISKHYSALHQKNIEIRTLFNFSKEIAKDQSLCLNRSIAKQKILIEFLRIGRQQIQQKCSQLQLECDRLKKKLNHYKEQDYFHKSYLSKLKISKINSQDEGFLILHEEKEELTTQIDDLQKQIQVKNETLKNNQTDLQNLLINFEKNQQKLLEIQKKYKQSEKQVKSNRQTRQKLESNIKLLQLKLQNQKQRFEEAQSQQQTRLKTMESSFEKKFKLLKQQLDQSYEREELMKSQAEQISKQFKTRIELLQQNHHKIERQLKQSIKLKSTENHELTTLLQDANQRLELEKESASGMDQRINLLMQTQTQLNKRLNEITDEHLKETSLHRQSQQNLNNIIQNILEKYNFFKLEHEQFKQSYTSRLSVLQFQLENSQLQSANLVNQLTQYSKHITVLHSAIEDINSTNLKEKQQIQGKLLSSNSMNEKFKLEIQNLLNKCREKEAQNSEFEEMVEKISEEMARLATDRESLSRDKTDLSQKLMFKDRQIETLNNYLNKKSEQLMIKTQELLQKEQLMLEQEQQSVMRKEEMDELRNQIQNSKKQITAKNILINQLQDHINELQDFKTRSIAQLQEKIGQIIKLQEKIAQMNNNLIHGRQALSSLKAQLLLKESQLTMSQQKETTLNDEKYKFQRNINEMKQQIAELQNQKKDFEGKFHQQITQNKHLIFKLSQKQNQLIEVNQALLTQRSKLQSIQITQNDETQNEITELLRQIQSKQNEIQSFKQLFKIKEQEINDANREKNEFEITFTSLKKDIKQKDKQIMEMKNWIDNLSKMIQQEQAVNIMRTNQNKKLLESIRYLQLDLLTVSGKKHQLEVTLRERLCQIEDLSKLLTIQREKLMRKQELTECLVKQESDVIQELIQDIHIKDQALINKEREIEGEQRLIQQLKSQKNIKQEEIRNVYMLLDEKIRIAEELKIKEEQNFKVMSIKVIQKQEQIAQLKKKIEAFSKMIEKWSNVPQGDERITLNDSGSHLILLNQQLKIKLDQKDIQINTLRAQVKDLKEKQSESSKKIALLEQNLGQKQFFPKNQQLQQNYKTLLDENTALMNEKIQLMKSNNYLVSINQKLVEDKGSNIMKELHRTQSHSTSTTNNKLNELKNLPAQDTNEAKNQTKGFFVALSSLFLTPTQVNRLRK